MSETHPDSSCLSFVADGKAKSGRAFWNVRSLGNHGQDAKVGEQLALQYLAYEARGGSPLLPSIVRDMPNPLTPIEISFLSVVDYAAAAGIAKARELCAYYEHARRDDLVTYATTSRQRRYSCTACKTLSW